MESIKILQHTEKLELKGKNKACVKCPKKIKIIR